MLKKIVILTILLGAALFRVSPANANDAQAPFLWSRLEPFDEGQKIAEAPRVSTPGRGYHHSKALRHKTVHLNASNVNAKKFPSDTVPSSSGVNSNGNVQYGTPVGGPAAAPWAYPPRYYYIYGYPNPNTPPR